MRSGRPASPPDSSPPNPTRSVRRRPQRRTSPAAARQALPSLRPGTFRRGSHGPGWSPPQRLPDGRAVGVARKAQGRRKGVEREPVVVGARGRAGAAVPDAPEVVPPLLRRVRRRRDASGEVPVRTRQVQDRPVDPVATIGIVDEEKEGSRPRRRAPPDQRGRHVFAPTGVLARDGAAIGERRRGEGETGWRGRRRGHGTGLRARGQRGSSARRGPRRAVGRAGCERGRQRREPRDHEGRASPDLGSCRGHAATRMRRGGPVPQGPSRPPGRTAPSRRRWPGELRRPGPLVAGPRSARSPSRRRPARHRARGRAWRGARR